VPTIDRRPTDTPRSLAALNDYAAMGAGRSLRDLAALYRRQSVDGSSTAKPPTTRFETLGTWSTAHDWQARVAVYDAAVASDAEADRAALRQQRRRELEDLDYFQGMDLRNRVSELLAEMPRFIRHTESEVRQNGELVKVITLALRAGPGELARALKLASEIQRLSVGEATEQIDSNQNIVITYVNDSPDNEAPAPGAAADYE
jgi:hypothetical protein